MNITSKVSLLLISSFFFIACSGAGHRAGFTRKTGRTANSGTVTGSKQGFHSKGEISYYGKKFHGRKTANGETFNQHSMTAAHKTIPFNTRVKVTLLSTGKSVVVRINDRGPFKKNRILDLSYGAAKKVGLVEKGTGTARLEIL